MDAPLPANTADIPSPALLILWDRVEENLRRMIALTPDPASLRPHLKTHKLPRIVSRLAALGVTKAKCATIAESEMAAAAGATDILLASQLVGPAISRFLNLSDKFPGVRFSTIADNESSIRQLNAAASTHGRNIHVFLDIDSGQHRTGIAPGPDAAALYHLIASLPGLTPAGLHAYDGHLHQSDPAERAAACHAAFAPVAALRDSLISDGLPVPVIVAGGSPTFPFHAPRPNVESSPGTCVLWDAGYSRKLPDLDFLHAAILLCRVISKPAPNLLCLDLGHKAVASEMPHPRVIFPALPDAVPVMHNEEHLVLESPLASNFPIGTALAGIPWHVCPTVALHDFVHIVHQGSATETLTVTARTRRISC